MRLLLEAETAKNPAEMGSTNEEAGNLGDTEGTNILASLFHSLEGSWQLERRLNSANASEPSGRCHGVAHFTSRPPSKVEGDIRRPGGWTQEMLYHEEGQFQMQGPSVGVQMPYMTFSRNYIWRIDFPSVRGPQPGISLWFAKPGTEELDYLFHGLIVEGRTSAQCINVFQGGPATIQAHGSHLCVEDQYETDYTFTITHHEDGAKLALAQWQTVHTVKGPHKDQRIETTFIRDDLSA